MKKFLAIVLTLAMLVLALPAFAAGAADLEGTYVLDAAPLGMPLKIYIIIDGEGNFQMSNKPVGGADKGHGTIGAEGNF